MTPRLLNSKSAFTLVEVLTVLAVFAIMLALVVPAYTNIQKERTLSRTGYELADTLNLARSYAMANNTYSWVGLLEENGKTVVSAVASKNGIAAPTQRDLSASNPDIIPISKTATYENINIAVPPTSSNRPSASQDAQLAEVSTAIVDFKAKLGTKTFTFDKKVIQFDSRGGARIVSGPVKRIVEVGIASVQSGSNNYVALQVGGLSGNVTVYRP